MTLSHFKYKVYFVDKLYALCKDFRIYTIQRHIKETKLKSKECIKMAKEHGSLSINSQNIFPIIKKWMYSDHDIFYRELISNACDAITKLKKLSLIGEYEEPDDIEYKVKVELSPKNKTITIIDNGLGMTSEEVNEYINQIAFSGAEAFLEQYKDKTNDDQIIGHFGLGFYSAFMVADKVTIDTLSYKKDATAVHWECDGGTDYDMSDSNKTEIGTTITLYLNEDSYEFCNEYKAREVLEKYCSFMPVEIFMENVDEEPKTVDIPEEELQEKDVVVKRFTKDAVTEEVEENGEKKTVEKEPAKKMVTINKRPEALNDIHPLWTKHPNECKKEDYVDFYHKVFKDYKEPLFWIHLNMDYPFNLKGILYFPKINMEYESAEGTIKLYNNQVFVADNIKEVIPEFLLLLKGVIDCPDLPLNVSRSALQNDGFVKKISDYITKKVADKLSGMCKTDRETYEKYWDDINPFIKYGCLKDEKFAEKMNDYIIFKNLEGKYLTLKEELEVNKEKHENTIFYVTNMQEQSQYINMFKADNIDALVLDNRIDQPFIQALESKNEGLKFSRVDASVDDSFKEDFNEDDLKDVKEKLTDTFKKSLGNDKLNIDVTKLKDENVSSMITLSEQDRRMQDMMKMYGMAGMDPSMFGANGQTLVLNANNKLVDYVAKNPEGENTKLFCEQIYDLALLAHAPLSAEAMTNFIQRSNKIMELLAK